MPHGHRHPARRGPGPAARSRPAAAHPARPPRGRPRPPLHAGAGARGPRRPAARRSRPATRPRAWSPPSTEPARARRSSCGATWTRCPCPRTPGSTSLSEVDGAMHACGHDTHTTMLVRRRSRCSPPAGRTWPGSVLFMFQPGEEGHHGARYMLDEGAASTLPTARPARSPAASAIHVTSALPGGLDRTPQRPIMASSDTPAHPVDGRGRPRVGAPPHARPRTHRVRDRAGPPDLGDAARSTSSTRPWSPSAASTPARRATSSRTPAEIHGTIRAVSDATRQRVHDGLRRVADGIAAAHEHDRHGRDRPGYPVTVNDDDFASFVHRRGHARSSATTHRRAAQPGHGRRGLQLRPPAGPRRHGLPRGRTQGASTPGRRRPTTRPRSTSTRTPWRRASPCTRALALRPPGQSAAGPADGVAGLDDHSR